METIIGSCGIAKDVADSHAKREERVGGSYLFLVAGNQVTKEGTTWTLEHIIGSI